MNAGTVRDILKYVEEGSFVLVVGGSPEPSSAGLIRQLASCAKAVVAVDHGLDALLGAGIPCDLFCGDADSVGMRALGAVKAAERGDAGRVRQVERYDALKDDTDLGLALRAVGERWSGSPLVCTCLTGGRPDHALAALGRIAAWRDVDAFLVEDGTIARVLHGPASWQLRDEEGETFSFVPLSPTATVSEAGMRWCLDCREVPLLSDLGISNVIEGGRARIDVHAGSAIAWVVRDV